MALDSDYNPNEMDRRFTLVLGADRLKMMESEIIAMVVRLLADKAVEELGPGILAKVDVQALANAAVAQAIREGDIMKKLLQEPKDKKD